MKFYVQIFSMLLIVLSPQLWSAETVKATFKAPLPSPWYGLNCPMYLYFNQEHKSALMEEMSLIQSLEKSNLSFEDFVRINSNIAMMTRASHFSYENSFPARISIEHEIFGNLGHQDIVSIRSSELGWMFVNLHYSELKILDLTIDSEQKRVSLSVNLNDICLLEKLEVQVLSDCDRKFTIAENCDPSGRCFNVPNAMFPASCSSKQVIEIDRDELLSAMGNEANYNREWRDD